MAYDVTLIGQTQPDFNYTFAISDNITDGDAVLGLAVCQDTTAKNTVKLATDGSEILGQIIMYEDRTSQGDGKVVTVATRGGMRFKVKTGESIAVGDVIVGAGDGEVREKVASGSGADTAAGEVVWEAPTGYAVILK